MSIEKQTEKLPCTGIMPLLEDNNDKLSFLTDCLALPERFCLGEDGTVGLLKILIEIKNNNSEAINVLCGKNGREN
jgi:hypothetical protein